MGTYRFKISGNVLLENESDLRVFKVYFHLVLHNDPWLGDVCSLQYVGCSCFLCGCRCTLRTQMVPAARAGAQVAFLKYISCVRTEHLYFWALNVLGNIYSWRPIVSFCFCVLWTDACILCISHGIFLTSVSHVLITSSCSVLTVVQWQEGADVAPRSPFVRQKTRPRSAVRAAVCIWWDTLIALEIIFVARI